MKKGVSLSNDQPERARQPAFFCIILPDSTACIPLFVSFDREISKTFRLSVKAPRIPGAQDAAASGP
ncbi:hypothetical protein [Fulvimarina manganoxydans]|uniref:hypothetical protein n=1 Tax=Fulvimarina manganoxydans TaxID=937218 RepID=UPI00111C17F3|nr:hypothetical protein [Fulvimarina manganoxydans]